MTTPDMRGMTPQERAEARAERDRLERAERDAVVARAAERAKTATPAENAERARLRKMMHRGF